MTDGNGSRRSLGVIVTGAASGIGRAVACSLAEDGFAVTATDINRAGLDDLEAEALVKKWVLKGAVMDVRDPPSVSAACHDVSAGAVGMAAFVHCAGITWRGSMLEMAGADYERIVGTNLGGSFICLTAAARALVSQGTGGSIVAITSVNAFRPLVSQALYSATKAAVEVLVQTLAVELGGTDVRVNSIAAGGIDTPMNAGGDGRDEWVQRLPLRRIGEPSDIASAVRFLVSEGASYITGASVVVDGGLAQVRSI